GLPPPPRAGLSARRRPSMLSAVTAWVRRGSSRVSCATAVVISEHGSWSGTVWSSVSSSQRILSLWLDRLSTDRIARQWREAPSPLVVFGKRGNLDLLLAVDAAAERLGLAPGLALAQARAMHPTLTAVPEDQADDTPAALARLGLKRIGDILDLPRAPLAARFGADLLRQLDRALGREDEPLTPRLPVARYIAEKSFHEPIAREEDVLASVERLAA